MIKTCTRGQWNFGGTSRCGSGVIELGPFILRPGSLFRDGKSRYQRGDWDGVVVSRDEYTSIGLIHGYIQPYGRNLTEFRQSRAARKRGYVSKDFWYNLNANRHTPEYIAQRKEAIRKILAD